MLHHHQASVLRSFSVHPFNLPICAFFRDCLFPSSQCVTTTCLPTCIMSLSNCLLRFEHLLFLSLSRSFFLTLFYIGALTKRPLFILFCQQPKRRGECPPNAIIQSTPLKDIHASHSRKLTISVPAIPNLLSRLSPSPASIFPLFRPLSFSLLFSGPVMFDREATPSRHERFHGTDCVFLFRGYFLRFQSSAAHAIPCQSQGSARLIATRRIQIDEEVGVQNVERLCDSGTKWRCVRKRKGLKEH